MGRHARAPGRGGLAPLETGTGTLQFRLSGASAERERAGAGRSSSPGQQNDNRSLEHGREDRIEVLSFFSTIRNLANLHRIR
jgi:hypothetical protein